MDYVNLPNSPYKLTEGWLQHKGTHDSKWVQYWCVIKEFTLYIFTNQETSRENHIGVLQLGSDTKYRTGESDEKKGYRFDLYTTKRLNKFRTAKFSERELWKAYIIGLAQGDVSDDLDLLPGQIHKVRDDIQRVRCKSQNPPLPISSSRMPPDSSSVGTGFSSPDNSITSIFPDNQSHLSLDNGGPMIRHRFWRDPDNNETPTWFFSGITRDIAEKILDSGGNYGNTLMRESVTFRDTGSYVITKKIEYPRRNPFNHFEVIRIAEGFKINVENAHKSILCLSEVMDYFVMMSGAAVTRPLVTNDLKTLGLEAPDYQTRIESKKTNPDSGEEYQAEDYEEPDVHPSNVQIMEGHKTWSPKSFPGNRGKGDGYGGHTVSSYGSRPRSSIDHVQQGVRTANVMRDLDSTINLYDPYRRGKDSTDHHWGGRSEMDEVGKLGQAPPPPCPSGRRQSQPDLHTNINTQGPVKQLHPRWQSRTKSVPNLGIVGDLSYLNKQVPVPSESPSLVSPTKTPQRPLPRPPEEEDTSEKSPPMSGLQRQLREAKLKPAGGPNRKAPLTPAGALVNPNTSHLSHHQQVRQRSYSSSSAQDQHYQPTGVNSRSQRSYSESHTTVDQEYYDDGVALQISDGKTVSFANTTSDDSASESAGATDKEGIKARLELLLAGGPRPTNPVQSMSAVPTSPVSQHPVEEEEYEDIPYESLDNL